MKKAKVIVILGPTSSGKTALSVELAKKFGGEVISADSRQVYRELDLGTGKVTKKEAGGIPHHLLNVADPKKQFSVAEYTKLANAAIADIVSRKKVPIICGGTGFYIDTLVNGIVLPEIPPNKKLRAELERKSVDTLFRMLEKIDPKRANAIDRNNAVRLIRAIEIAKTLGTVPDIKKKKSPHEFLKIGLDTKDCILRERISVRLAERVKKGMLKEAQHLHENGLSWKRMRNLGLEYRHMADLLAGKTPEKDFKHLLAADIWGYAKRQRTWFKRDKKIVWLDPAEASTLKKAESIVKRFLAEPRS